jgi:hypothetical protein
VSFAKVNIHLSIGLAVINLEFLVGLLAIPTRSLFAKTCCDRFFALLSPGVLVAAAAELKD